MSAGMKGRRAACLVWDWWIRMTGMMEREERRRPRQEMRPVRLTKTMT